MNVQTVSGTSDLLKLKLELYLRKNDMTFYICSIVQSNFSCNSKVDLKKWMKTYWQSIKMLKAYWYLKDCEFWIARQKKRFMPKWFANRDIFTLLLSD